MRITLAILATTSIFLSACNNSSGGSGSPEETPGPSSGNKPIANDGSIKDWQTTSVGQEGHGGDAIVCFNVPVNQALQKIDLRRKSNCIATDSTPCSQKTESSMGDGSSSTPPDVIWKMTALGRKSIQSAKPLEQYLAERIAGKKALIAELNKLSVEDGFEALTAPLKQLPAAYSQVASVQKKLGWLQNDGISSEFGLADINDSGFVNETDIDTNYCKELQAVVRRDNQLWYDKDIVSHFDNAGLVLMQAHEVIYTWGKEQDKNNRSLHWGPSHQTSEKSRRFILKLLDSAISTDILNQQLKDLGFSIYHWGKLTKFPTSLGYFMTTTSCQEEQKNLRLMINTFPTDSSDFWMALERHISQNYLKTDDTEYHLELKNNYPESLSAMISYIYLSPTNTPNFRQNIYKFLDKFEQPQSCVGN